MTMAKAKTKANNREWDGSGKETANSRREINHKRATVFHIPILRLNTTQRP
jgi:hypothetical protein